MIDPITGSIDPVKVQEANCRIQRRHQECLAAGRAADALLWFKEFAEGRDVTEVLKGKVSVIASATPHAPMAQSYVDRALASLLPSILAKAVGYAMGDFERADV